MTQPLATLWPLLTAGFGVAFVHAALPTHWLPFVLAGRAQHWSDGKTLGVTAAAGGGHVAFTAALGLLAAGAGAAVDRWSTSVFPWLAGGVLVAFGLYYLWLQRRGGGHGHFHFTAPGHDHPHGDGHAHAHRGDKAVILGLLAMLSFSPCEGFLPLFVAGAREGWSGYLWLSAALAAATLLGMLVFTWLTLRGLQHLKLDRLARHEHAIVGAMLLAIGAGIWIFEGWR